MRYDSNAHTDLVRMASRAAESPAGEWNALLPIVRRAVQTGEGPAAVVRWVHQAMAQEPAAHPGDRLARELTDQLVRHLCGTPQSMVDTVRM